MKRNETFRQDDFRTINFFTGLLNCTPSGAAAVNWGSRFSQELRFRVLADIGIHPGASVLDVGCGLGEFFEWQKREGLEVRYHGIDITPAMVGAAQSRFPEASFQVGDASNCTEEIYDFIIASGIFYLRKREPQSYLEETVERLFRQARIGFAFNSLSAWSTNQLEGEFYADPVRTLQFCRTICQFVTLRHDYHPGDFTMHLRHTPMNQ